MPLRQRSALLSLLVATSAGTSAHAKGFRLAWTAPSLAANVRGGGGGGALLQESELVTALDAASTTTQMPPSSSSSSSRATTRTRERRQTKEWHAEEGESLATSLDSEVSELIEECDGGVRIKKGRSQRRRDQQRKQRSNEARRRGRAGGVKRPAHDDDEAYESLSEVEEEVMVAQEQSGLNRSVDGSHFWTMPRAPCPVPRAPPPAAARVPGAAVCTRADAGRPPLPTAPDA